MWPCKKKKVKEIRKRLKWSEPQKFNVGKVKLAILLDNGVTVHEYMNGSFNQYVMEERLPIMTFDGLYQSARAYKYYIYKAIDCWINYGDSLLNRRQFVSNDKLVCYLNTQVKEFYVVAEEDHFEEHKVAEVEEYEVWV